MVNVQQVADAADMIVNGYAFSRCPEGFRVLNLNRPDRAVVFSPAAEVLETSIKMHICMISKSFRSLRIYQDRQWPKIS